MRKGNYIVEAEAAEVLQLPVSLVRFMRERRLIPGAGEAKPVWTRRGATVFYHRARLCEWFLTGCPLPKKVVGKGDNDGR